MSRRFAIFAAVVLLCAPALLAQGKKKGEDQTRNVQGVVTSPEDAVVGGAVVYLKNLKTLQIRSFITKPDGTYYFHGLSTDVDYEVRADSKEQGLASPTKTLSSFDSRRDAVINLKLNKKS
ncbi:MAG: carboxypeptidase-like regulatory domain-containing protein [Acidobacteriia bacterium]|nr:carboxypeptidase-like regulatory domain-containing protein [Terriglobia bacterium]